MPYNTGTDPTLAELITGKFIPETYSKNVIFHTMSNLVVGKCVNTDYRSDLRYGSKVNISVFSEISTTEVTPGTEPTAADAVGTPTSITVDKWREATVEISDMAKIEDYVGYMNNAAKAAGYAVAKYVDTTVGALFSTLGGSAVYGADGQTFTDDIFLALMETLDEADVPDDGNRHLIGDSSTRIDMLKIDKFIRSDYVRESSVPTGKIGSIYNVQVWNTNNLTVATTGNYGVLMHRDALGLVIQNNPRTQAWNLGWKFVQRIITDVIFGCGELRDGFGKAFYTRSS